MNIMKQQIKNLFKNPQKAMEKGLWFSGYEGEGEYKQWWDNGLLRQHGFYKDGKLNGENKEWDEVSGFWGCFFYKDDQRNGDCKIYNRDNIMTVHQLYKDDILIKDYLK